MQFKYKDTFNFFNKKKCILVLFHKISDAKLKILLKVKRFLSNLFLLKYIITTCNVGIFCVCFNNKIIQCQRETRKYHLTSFKHFYDSNNMIS